MKWQECYVRNSWPVGLGGTYILGKGAAESFVMGGISVTLDLLLMALNWESFWRTISSEEFKMGGVSVTPAETLGLKYILIALNQDFFWKLSNHDREVGNGRHISDTWPHVDGI